MRRFLQIFFALLFSQILLGLAFLFLLAGFVLNRDARYVESGSLLNVRVVGEILEYQTLPTVPVFRKKALTETAILESLRYAADDERIVGAFVDIAFPQIGWGKAHEIRESILRFRESGKPVWAYADVLDEIGLYIASAADSIVVPPLGKIYLNGIGFTTMHFKGTFDKIGIEPNFQRIGDYKSAPEVYTREELSASAREQEEWLLDALWDDFVATVATSRNLEHGNFEEALQLGAIQPDIAAERGFIDKVRHRSDVFSRYRDSAGKPLWIGEMDYYDVIKRDLPDKGKAIAIVHTQGLILRGSNGYHPMTGTILGADSVVHDLDDAAKDKDVVAIVLRIDSGGGEIVASDIIGDAVRRARLRKPVIVSMVDVAASGGYMMSYRANALVANPTTITGSIGAYTGKFNLRGLYEYLGITQDHVTRGAYPMLFSEYQNWTPEEAELIGKLQQEDYERWIAAIAAHRGLTPIEVDAVGQGRVWTGRQALTHHLVDQLGDVESAVEIALDMAVDSIPAEEARRVHYPRERGFFDWFFEDTDVLMASVFQGWIHSLELPPLTHMSVFEARPIR